VGESLDYFSFGDVMYLSMQLTKSVVIISEALASFLFESLQLYMGDRVCDDTYNFLQKALYKSSHP
jgi:hypothetical protein